MLRYVLLLTSLLLLMGLRAEVVLPVDQVVVDADDDHCCPDADDAEGDCCEWDFGACCSGASTMAAGLPPVTRAAPADTVASVSQERAVLPVHLLRPRDNGPPPTPPPIG